MSSQPFFPTSDPTPATAAATADFGGVDVSGAASALVRNGPEALGKVAAPVALAGAVVAFGEWAFQDILEGH